MPVSVLFGLFLLASILLALFLLVSIIAALWPYSFISIVAALAVWGVLTLTS
jgi:hypothetical protein